MVWTLGKKETQAILTLNDPERYRYCVKKVADERQIWSLWADGWALADDDEGRTLVPVWPHSDFALACANGQWTGFEPRAIGLEIWLERWIPGMARDGRLVAVFPSPSGRGVIVSPTRFDDDVRNELEKYE